VRRFALAALVPANSRFADGFTAIWKTEVGFLFVPLFAPANAGLPLEVSDLGSPMAIEVMAGLVIGRPVGIVLASWLAVRLVMGKLPEGWSWSGVIAPGGPRPRRAVATFSEGADPCRERTAGGGPKPGTREISLGFAEVAVICSPIP
jgi:hypothetical protein